MLIFYSKLHIIYSTIPKLFHHFILIFLLMITKILQFIYFQILGINAHPGQISAISVSHDGKYFFTAGGTDLSAYMFDINLNNFNNDNTDDNDNNNNNLNNFLDPSNSLSRKTSNLNLNLNLNLNSITTKNKTNSNSKNSIKYFLALLEGGDGGDLHEDIIEYFYFCQLRAQGEESLDERTISGVIPIEEIPSLMRALGYYPSEAQVADMTNEVRMLIEFFLY